MLPRTLSPRHSSHLPTLIMDIALFLVLAWSLFTQVCPVSLDDAQTALTQNVQIIAQKGYAGIEAPYGYGVTTGGQGGKVYTVATDGDLHKALNVTTLSSPTFPFLMLYSTGQGRQTSHFDLRNDTCFESHESAIENVNYWTG